MAMLQTSTKTEQTAAHLRAELRKGRWRGLMPGRRTLARELGLNHNTVKAALDLLEAEGVLVPQGVGRRREIVLDNLQVNPVLRVGILLYELSDRKIDYTVELRHALEAAGHIVVFAPKSLLQLGMDVPQVARLVDAIEADAWVVCSASREVLEWFAGQARPSFALFGRRRGIRIAGTGPDKRAAQQQALRRLVALGHERIVLLVHEERRKPVPGQIEQAFLDELSSLGITTGAYNLPDWEDSPAGLRDCLDALFQHTPPTALIVQVVPLFIAVQQHLANRGIVVPRDVSLICGDQDIVFDWCDPAIAQIAWDASFIVRRIVGWVDKLSREKNDRRQSFIQAEFVEGGTIGPCRGA